MIIYKATNKINKKIYIGQTTNTLDYRASQHLREARSPKKKNTYFHNAINKYGFENFDFKEIDQAQDLETLNQKEQYWIQYYDSTNKLKGYNLDSGGANCFKSESTKRKIGDTTVERWNNPEIAQKMKAGLDKATKTWIQMCYDQRAEFKCPVCGTELKLPKHALKNKLTCSQKCATQFKTWNHLVEASKKKHQDHITQKKLLADQILAWCEEHRELILNCPYNHILTTLQPMLDYFNINDIRSIFVCFDVGGRKELLQYLKNYLINENIC